MAPTRSCWSAAKSTAASGCSRTAISKPPRPATPQRGQPCLRTRSRPSGRFQSEIAAIREAPDPLAARITLYVLVALVLAFVAVLVFMQARPRHQQHQRQDHAERAAEVYQALDPSIIKTIDVRAGDLVKKGQVLATLDPTFAAADVEQLSQQIASLNPQILRDEAELAGKAPSFRLGGCRPKPSTSSCRRRCTCSAARNTSRSSTASTKRKSWRRRPSAKTKGDIARFRRSAWTSPRRSRRCAPNF